MLKFLSNTRLGTGAFNLTDHSLSDLSVLKSIDEYKFGKNLKISAGDLGSQEHPMMCNGCSSNSNGPRYIALSCRKGYPKNGV